MTEHDGAVVAPDKKKTELKLPSSIDPSIAERLVEQAQSEGVDLVGPDGLLGELTKQVLETGLEVEMEDHLGYDKHAPEGRDGGNSRNGKRSKTVITEVGPIETMSQLPQTLRRTLTWDQGNEMANHAAIADAAELDIYFCDPHSPWQRGTNENTNGLLRQYFPKGTDLSGYHRDYLDFIAAQLNNRPRKRLRWHTPAETLDQLPSGQKDPPGVAPIG